MTLQNAEKNVSFEVARLTPIGRGAVACVGVRGTAAWGAFLERWSRADGREVSEAFKNWAPDVATRPYFGRFRLDEIGGESEEIVLRRRTETAFELDGHGGDVVSSAVVRFFVERGATEVSGDRWERAVERDESQGAERVDSPLEAFFFAAADELVAQTKTETTAKIALDQRRHWREFFAELASELREVERDASNATTRLRRLAQKIDSVARKFELGRRLTEPFVVLLTGVPNAGKSSLLNALLGFERVVVSPTSGTTRDLVDAPKVIDGWTFRFVDAAGLRETTDPIERAGTRLAVDAAAKADVALRVFDATVEKSKQESVFHRFFDAEDGGARNAADAPKTLNVLNKIDLSPVDRAADWANGEPRPFSNDSVSGSEAAFLPVSAKTGRGIDELLRAILAKTVGDAMETAGGPLPWTTAQLDFLRELRAAVERGDFDAAFEKTRPF